MMVVLRGVENKLKDLRALQIFHADNHLHYIRGKSKRQQLGITKPKRIKNIVSKIGCCTVGGDNLLMSLNFKSQYE